jgi:hypothetical protein
MAQNETPEATNNVPDDALEEFAEELVGALESTRQKIEESKLADVWTVQVDTLMAKIEERMNNGTLTEFRLKLFENQVNNLRNRVNEKIKDSRAKVLGKTEDEIKTKRNWISNFLWKLYEKTLKVVVDSILEKLWSK